MHLTKTVLNNMGKQRIKEVIDSKGVSKFYPQYKFLCVWRNYKDSQGFIYVFDTYRETKEWIKWIEYEPVAKTKIHKV
jgi:hypothetical protein